jgi:uncharacterized protein YlxP (DUF503 family)
MGKLYRKRFQGLTRKRKRYTVNIRVERDKEPKTNWITVAELGRGEIYRVEQIGASTWAVDAAFQVDCLRHILSLLDERFVSTSVH